MQPIVDEVRKQYGTCLKFERVNLNAQTPWQVLLAPVGSPEFVLLDPSKNVIHRWFGITEKEELTGVMGPLCGG